MPATYQFHNRNLNLKTVKLSAAADNELMPSVTVTDDDGTVNTTEPLWSSYGIVALPKDGTIALTVRDGQITHVIATTGESRPTLTDEGDVAVYSNSGTYLLLKDNGNVEIHGDSIKLGASTKALITTDLITAFNSHTHAGVTSGLATTAVPSPLITDVSPSPPGSVSVATTKTEAE